MVNIHEVLRLAAEDSEQAYNDNLDREPSMRMSRAGLPLLQLALEDFIFPRLPKLATEEENTGSLSRTQAQRKHKRTMALSLGFLYEKVVGAYLADEHPGFEVWAQQKLEYEGITGTCDYLLLDNENKRAIVIECKALDVDTLKEAKENKLLVDNWGYLSQLCLYGAAVQQKYPEYDIELQWRVWAKKASKSFVYKYTDGWETVVDTAVNRSSAYNIFKRYWSDGNVNACVNLLFAFTDPLPLRQFYYGQLCASCGLHFSPWANALLDADGQLLPEIESVLRRMLHHCFNPTPKSEKVLLNLLDLPKYTAV